MPDKQSGPGVTNSAPEFTFLFSVNVLHISAKPVGAEKNHKIRGVADVVLVR